MTTLKTLKDGRIALIFEVDQVGKASQLFAALVGGHVPILPLDIQTKVKKPKSLGEIAQRLKSTVVPALPNLVGFDAEQSASVICALIAEKQLEIFGKSAPGRYATFYKELERYTGAPLKLGYKNYSAGRSDVEKREYPFRKIDYILTVLPHETVYEFAKAFQYSTAEAVSYKCH